MMNNFMKDSAKEIMQKINGEQAAKIGAFGVAGGILWLMLKELLKSL